MAAPLGSPLKRKEDPRLLTGRGRFVDDLCPPRMLHAAIARSPHAHARIVLAGPEVRHAGEAVAVVVAEDAYCAADAAEALRGPRVQGGSRSAGGPSVARTARSRRP